MNKRERVTVAYEKLLNYAAKKKDLEILLLATELQSAWITNVKGKT